MTIRETILRAFLQALSTGAAPAPVSRSLSAVLDAEKLPAIVVLPTDESVETAGRGVGIEKARVLTVNVVCVVAATSEEGPVDEKADPLLEWVEQVIAANRELAGALNVQVTGTKWQHESGEMDFVGAVVEVQIEYETLNDASTVGV